MERTRAARQKATESGASVDLGRLKIISVVLPVTFVVVGELFRFLFVETDPTHRAEHVALAVILVVSVLAFSAVMFTLIERAQRSVIRQNRELAAVNAVSTAVQGELGVDEVIDAALVSVISSTGATEATVTVFPREHGPRGEGTIERRVAVGAHVPELPALGAEVPHLIDIPLAVGPSVVGRMRLHMPADAQRPDLLESATLANIGHQLACSIQMTSLISDLQRRRLEGHAFYDILLQVSNQHPIADVLASVVRHARELLQSDDAVLCLTRTASEQLDGESMGAGFYPLADGTLCLCTEPERFADLPERPLVCPVRSAPDLVTSLEVRVESGDGTARRPVVGRRDDKPYTSRDRGFLAEPREPREHRDRRRAACGRASARPRSSPSASGSPARCTTASRRCSARPTCGCARSSRARRSWPAGARQASWPTSPTSARRPTATSARRSSASARPAARTAASSTASAPTSRSTAASRA